MNITAFSVCHSPSWIGHVVLDVAALQLVVVRLVLFQARAAAVPINTGVVRYLQNLLIYLSIQQQVLVLVTHFMNCKLATCHYSVPNAAAVGVGRHVSSAM